ncbi:hypothetical protein [Pseudomonas putida]|uniref:hypothetical protein n=1 Tax=Pseudomonas putida TaxID=303 RepID=UPI002B2500DF|nr:hypothetical protein [Pseudomonas putida]
MADKPATAQTIAGATQDGTLPAMNRIRLRAQLGMAEDITAANIRRATALVLQRVQDYYSVVQYTGPAYVYGRVDSEYPSALYAEARHNYMNDTWIHQEMSPTHTTCTAEVLFREAGWLCLDTACRLAVHELAEEVPEAREVLNQARYAVREMCRHRELTELNWADSRRRLGTPGIRKMLKRLSSKLKAVRIGKGCIIPVILPPGRFAISESYRNIADWSYEDRPLAHAC